jgi:hypothetical protein
MFLCLFFLFDAEREWCVIKIKNSPSSCEQGEFVFIVSVLLQDYFNQRSSQLKKRRCQSTLFCG